MQGKEEGFAVEPANYDDEEDAETWEEAMDEMEDPWMREPAGRSVTQEQISCCQHLCMITANLSLLCPFCHRCKFC